jgi:hypothetical protein
LSRSKLEESARFRRPKAVCDHAGLAVSGLWPRPAVSAVPQTGIEPVAYRLGGGRSIRLSYWGQTCGSPPGSVAASGDRRGEDPGESSASTRSTRPAVHPSCPEPRTRPCWWANTTICTRSRKASLRRMAPTWVFTVDSLTKTSLAISVFDRPRATAAKTSRSLSVSDENAVGAGVRGPKLLSSSVVRSVGASTALPLCTVRIASASSWGVVSFSRKPLAP